MTSLLRELVSVPIASVASSTITSRPCSASARATARPTTPAPMTTQSAVSVTTSSESLCWEIRLLSCGPGKVEQAHGDCERDSPCLSTSLGERTARGYGCGLRLAATALSGPAAHERVDVFRLAQPVRPRHLAADRYRQSASGNRGISAEADQHGRAVPDPLADDPARHQEDRFRRGRYRRLPGALRRRAAPLY